MFTGIVEDLGIVKTIKVESGNIHFTLSSNITGELKIDQSVAHNGVCLTVVDIEDDCYTVTAIDETLKKTNLSNLKLGDEVNLERCLAFGDRVDGHMVYGHVDTTGDCIDISTQDGSWIYTVGFASEFMNLVVEKGSISLNGTSLTVFDVSDTTFSVAIIPYTYDHTSIKKIEKGDKINLEFDIFGKYVEKHLRNR